jgi:hypothetical protein
MGGVATLVLLVMAVRFGGVALLPSLLDRVGKGLGLAITYARLEISLIGGTFELRGLDVARRPAEGAAASADDRMVHLDHLALDWSSGELLLGRLHVNSAVVSGLTAKVARAPDGSFGLDGWSPPPAAAVPPAPPAPAPAPVDLDAPFDFTLPLRVDRVRVDDVAVTFRDEAVTPPWSTVARVDLGVSDVGSPERATRLQLFARATGLVESVVCMAQVRSGEALAEADVSLDVTGVHAGVLPRFLPDTGISAAAKQISFGCDAKLHVAPGDSKGRSLTGSFELARCEVAADLERQAAVTAAVQVKTLTRRGAVLDGVDLSVEAAATRLADGALRACGVELRPPPSATASTGEPGAAAPTVASHEDASASFLLSVAEVRPRLQLRLRDETVAPAADLEVALHDSTLRNFTLDPARKSEPIELALALDAAGAQVTIGGKVVPFDVKRSAELALAVALPKGLAALAPYLEPTPVASTLEDAKLSFEVSAQLAEGPAGALEIEAALARLALTDRGGKDVLFALERLAATGVVLDPAGPIRIGDVRLEKLHARAFTDAERSLRVAGLRTRAPVLDPTAPPVDLELSDLGLELHGLELGSNPGAEPPPATFALRAAVRDLCDELALAGTLQMRPGPLDLTAQAKLAAKGLRTKLAEPWLERAGIRGDLADGSLGLELVAAAKQDGKTLRAKAQLTALSLKDGERPLVALAALHALDVQIDDDGIRLGKIAIEQPTLAARRDADGALHAAGIVLPARRPAEPAVAAVPAPAAEPSHAGTPAPANATDPAPSPAPAAPAAPAAAPPAVPLELAELALSGARVDWNDDAVAPAVATQLQADVRLARLVVGKPAEPAEFSVDVALRDAVERLHLGGTLSTDPQRLGANLDVELDGARAGPLAAYLPPTVELTTKAGRLRLHAEAELAAREGGGKTARVEVKGFDWRDGEDGEPFLVLDRFAFVAPQLDLPDGDVVVDEITTTGLKVRARRASKEVFEGLGLKVTLPAAPATPPATPPAAPPAAPPAGAAPPGSSASSPPSASPSVPPVDVAVAPRRRPLRPGSLLVRKLDLGIDALHFEGAPVDGVAPPPVHGSLHLLSREPFELLPRDPEKTAPIALRVEGAVDPVVRSIAVDLTCAPFADMPEFDVAIAVDGLDGNALPTYAPLFSKKVDATAIRSGSFTAKLHGELGVKRHGPTDLDLRNGFSAELEVSDVAWRAEPDGPVLAGVEGIHVDVKSIRPTTGDVHVRSIEVRGIQGDARVTPEGIATAGILIKQAPPAEPAASEAPPAAEPVASDAPPPAEPAPAPSDPPAPAAAANAAGRPEIRVDEIVVSGVRFGFRSELSTPPLELPITDLELLVQRFSTRAIDHARPIDFRLVVNAGDLDFKKRDERGLVGGLIGGVVDVVRPGEKPVETEKRPAWDEIAVSGQLALHPKPKGWVRLGVSTLELQTFKAEAARSGVEISDGTLDTDVELRLRDDGVSVNSDTTLTWLSMTEPPNGPISSYLKLPAPLDSVLYLLRDSNGQQRLPVNFQVEGDQVSASQVTEVATRTLLRLITEAVKGAPMRIVSGTLDAAQLSKLPGVSYLTDPASVGRAFTKDDTPAYTGESVVIECAPGVATLPPDARARLEPLFQQMRADDSITLVAEHRLGRDDIEALRRSSTPTAQECADLATRLRLRRRELAGRRDAAAAEARARFAIGRPVDAEPLLETMRMLERESADVEDALDRALEAASRTTGRVADHRIRAACLGLADLRVADAHEVLLEAGVKGMANRFEIKRVRGALREQGKTGCIVVTPHRKKK